MRFDAWICAGRIHALAKDMNETLVDESSLRTDRRIIQLVENRVLLHFSVLLHNARLKPA